MKIRILNTPQRASKFAEGGMMPDMANNINYFGAGGTHEENPNEGIPQGINNQDGRPNLVEEGEVRYDFDDGGYIFSKRNAPTKEMLKEFKLPTRYAGKPFSDIAVKIQEENVNRENQNISNKTTEEMLYRLRACQEAFNEQMKNQELDEAFSRLSPQEKESLLAQGLEGQGQQGPSPEEIMAQQQQMQQMQQMGNPQGEMPMQGGQPSEEEMAQMMAMQQGGQPGLEQMPPEEMMQPGMRYGGYLANGGLLFPFGNRPLYGHKFANGGPYGQKVGYDRNYKLKYTGIGEEAQNKGDGDYVDKVKYITKYWDSLTNETKEEIINIINDYNRNRPGYKKYVLGDPSNDNEIKLTAEMLLKGALDGKGGGMHQAIENHPYLRFKEDPQQKSSTKKQNEYDCDGDKVSIEKLKEILEWSNINYRIDENNVVRAELEDENGKKVYKFFFPDNTTYSKYYNGDTVVSFYDKDGYHQITQNDNGDVLSHLQGDDKEELIKKNTPIKDRSQYQQSTNIRNAGMAILNSIDKDQTYFQDQEIDENDEANIQSGQTSEEQTDDDNYDGTEGASNETAKSANEDKTNAKNEKDIDKLKSKINDLNLNLGHTETNDLLKSFQCNTASEFKSLLNTMAENGSIELDDLNNLFTKSNDKDIVVVDSLANMRKRFRPFVSGAFKIDPIKYAILNHNINDDYQWEGPYSSNIEDIELDLQHGTWDHRKGSDWDGSTDAAWSEAKELYAKENNGADLAKADEATVSQYLKKTTAYQKGTEWLKDKDNARQYAQYIINHPDGVHQRALEEADKIIEACNDGTYDYDTHFKKLREENPGVFWKTWEGMTSEMPVQNFNYIIHDDGSVEEMRDATGHTPYGEPVKFNSKRLGDTTYNYFYDKKPNDNQSEGQAQQAEKKPIPGLHPLGYSNVYGSGLMAALSMLEPLDYKYANDLDNNSNQIVPPGVVTMGGYQRPVYHDTNNNLNSMMNANAANASFNSINPALAYNSQLLGLQNDATIQDAIMKQQAQDEDINSKRKQINNDIDYKNMTAINTFLKENSDYSNIIAQRRDNAAKARSDSRDARKMAQIKSIQNLFENAQALGKEQDAINFRNWLVQEGGYGLPLMDQLLGNNIAGKLFPQYSLTQKNKEDK